MRLYPYTLRAGRDLHYHLSLFPSIGGHLIVTSEWKGGLIRVVILHILKVIYIFPQLFVSIISFDHNNNSNVGPRRSYFFPFTEGVTKAQWAELNLLLTYCVEALISSLLLFCTICTTLRLQ